MSSNENDQLRRFTARNSGSVFNYGISTAKAFESEAYRLEIVNAMSDQVINCYDRVVTLKKKFDMESGLNCMKKYHASSKVL